MGEQKGFRERFWTRHSNPLSGITRMTGLPMLYIAIWYRSWIVLVLTMIWLIINPMVFPEPKNQCSWFSRIVIGEKRWVEKDKSKAEVVLSIATFLFFVLSLYYAYENIFWPTLYFLVH